MFNSSFKIFVCLFAMAHFGSAQALPMSGEVNFAAYRDFTVDGNGDLSGYDLQ